jgi:ribosomal 50S subunit-recycling heat shock protein
MSEEACRIDVWLWRARFFKTRSMAARFIDEGRVRLTRRETEIRIGKPSHLVKSDDSLVFAIGGRVIMVRIQALGERRGPAAQVRALYRSLDESVQASGENAPVQENWAPADVQQR